MRTLENQVTTTLQGCKVNREGKAANRQSPLDCREKLSLEHVEFRYRYSAHLGVKIVCTERVAEPFAGDRDRSDDKAVTSER